MSFSYHMEKKKKHFSKQVVVWMICRLGNDFFAVATFKGLWDVSFQIEYQNL